MRARRSSLDPKRPAPARAGTIAYMSPELLQHGKLTKLNDVYSFAMLIIELWTSRRLFQGLSQQQARRPARPRARARPRLPGRALPAAGRRDAVAARHGGAAAAAHAGQCVVQ